MGQSRSFLHSYPLCGRRHKGRKDKKALKSM